ncbi:MAG: DUF202 domain-containing protein [Solirubrobacteraceae bacterium]
MTRADELISIVDADIDLGELLARAATSSGLPLLALSSHVGSDLPVPQRDGRYRQGADDSTRPATRRTHLANERTYLAWWRTGITALAGGKLVPSLAHGARWPYVVLGAGSLWGSD